MCLKKLKKKLYHDRWKWTQVLSSCDCFPAVTNLLSVQVSRIIFPPKGRVTRILGSHKLSEPGSAVVTELTPRVP